ncbi:Fe-S cluster assembly protein SufD [Luteococcus sp. Sow4_B9]|uniref:Fe-S cluster assembly protein SufD n=1 Tax=Luteococcus sp. Sow4_B9 TaxID=3438792 RepID=UPI003F998140
MSTDTAPAVASALELETVASHLHPTPSWDVQDHPEPTGREEIWRFTPMKRIAPLLAAQGSTDNLGWETSIPAGVTMEQIDVARARELAVEAPTDRVAALASQNAAYGVHIDVPADSQVTEPVVLTGTGQGGVVSEQTVVTIGSHAEVTLVLHFKGSATFAEKTDIRVSPGAQVTVVTLQDWADDAVHGGQRSVLVGRDAHVRLITASLGGDVIRLQEDVRYDGPGGELEQYGLYFVDEGQHIQHRIFVDHNEPRTKSNVDYRGALQGKGAHSVWIGDVLIRKAAEEIETYEANKNLVLTDGCKADSVPNLEIETGEIAGAGHSSTTGHFDDAHLFYLMSRGIPEQEARRLVVQGFFFEIIRRIGIEDIEARLVEAVEEELAFLEAAAAEGER